MIIGCPTEIKSNEARVGLTPAGTRELVKKGHTVLVQPGAGILSGFPDEDYQQAGAQLSAIEDLWSRADIIVKVKELQPSEYRLMHPGQVIFTYLHLAADPAGAQVLKDAGVTAIAYETVTGPRLEGLLAPQTRPMTRPSN